MKKHFNSRLHHYVFILTLVVFSLIGVGFSSYLIEGNNNSGKSDVNINVGEVNKNLTINDGIYYVFKSEYAFDYFKIDSGQNTEYVCTSSNIGFKVKITLSKLIEAINLLKNKQSNLYIDINISYQSNTNFDMFSTNNENTIVNDAFIFSMIEKPKYIYKSLNIDSSFINSNGNINARALLYSDSNVSLLDFTQELTNKEDIYFNVYLPFILKENFSFIEYEKLSFELSVSLNTIRG